jgi:prepilin-type processing-associated H-X9-DG protein
VTSPEAAAGKSLENSSWVAGWLSTSGGIPTVILSDQTNILMLTGEKYRPFGSIGGYMNKNYHVYRCPADKSTVMIRSRALPRVRSISMNAFVGYRTRGWSSDGSRWIKFRKQSDFTGSSPAKTFVYLDEREDSINDGAFYVSMDAAQIIDFPASYHNGSAGLAYADGHAGFHKWVDPRTMPGIKRNGGLSLMVISRQNADIDWLREHTTLRVSR